MAKQIKKLKTPNLQQPLTAELLGEVIKARRTQSNLRLEDAAALCGVAKETFMKIEHGQSNCQLASVLQICSGLGISLYIKPWMDNSENENDWR
ncbi:helix-turn-helix transcriptional regulator [Legionella pneumophila serogroup 1]|uniref:helix-turn-helix domain-containing protein n=1 Tax=Legionella pneumophila TaxID=446 RepID=UPI00077081CC|nr:helix-turn-helix transcriptional regulator [Legionella pneumophila]HAT8823147.1 helix-turn-helix domain-containing protein [Legionella pneumophila subsp. pneumophila]MCZ4738819.1 helix-turn-helix transcriptional regulator [Legionella pneumophila]MCZ4747719.1 helix-turn-helix transcriptional regulator [Legionella pneumophila]MDI9846336.1 helix-turn-helix transcriptional regulator [Legionella pneumophila]MDO5160002.1 helix-turn-helix transcriptional regulator [Legionella pneumophila]